MRIRLYTPPEPVSLLQARQKSVACHQRVELRLPSPCSIRSQPSTNSPGRLGVSQPVQRPLLFDCPADHSLIENRLMSLPTGPRIASTRTRAWTIQFE